MKTIYALVDDDLICYIGKTETSKLHYKLEEHIAEAKSNPEKFGWLTKIFSSGRKPKLIPIFTYSVNDEEYYEKIFISHYRFFLGLKHTQNIFKFPGAN